MLRVIDEEQQEEEEEEFRFFILSILNIRENKFSSSFASDSFKTVVRSTAVENPVQPTASPSAVLLADDVPATRPATVLQPTSSTTSSGRQNTSLDDQLIAFSLKFQFQIL